MWPPVALGDLSVSIGPTTIPRGDAVGAKDITIQNDRIAIAIAVETAPPWGVARGGIVDIAVVRDGEPGYDIASLADFMPNNWSSWPTTYQQVSVEKNTVDEVVIKTRRDWGKVDLETVFRVRGDDNRIHITTRMTNNGITPLQGLLSGYVVWPDGGYPIVDPIIATAMHEDVPGVWTAAYDKEWALGLRAPFADIATRDGRDRYLKHDLGPGESRTFEACLQIESNGALAGFVQSEIRFSQLPSGRVKGRVQSVDGTAVDRPAVVVTRHGRLFAWATGRDGSYEFDLPAGDYELYAMADRHSHGQAKKIRITSDKTTELNFDDVVPPGRIEFQIVNKKTGRPLDARISIKDGYQPLIRYFGSNTFFTELHNVGRSGASIAPGAYVFEVSAGGGFTSARKRLQATVVAGKTSKLKTKISILADPNAFGWYGVDLHHHSDVLDGFTEPEFVLRSELAAGVDMAFLSDHDSVVNNREMQTLSESRGIQFIPAAEMSPSWAHFNVYPLFDVDSIDIDSGQSSVQEIFSAARKLGADVIETNHPYSSYGYFESLDRNAVPGGYDAGFDLVEIEADDADANKMTVARVWKMWNDGQRKYLAAGSDVHDVWLHESGAARTYVYIDGDLSIEKYIRGLKTGNSYASQGPLVYPDILFGQDVQHTAGEALELRYSVQAVSGLKSVRLIERGAEISARELDGTQQLVPVEFTVRPGADTWYSLVIEDVAGKFAFTNPVWVSTSK